MPFVPSLPCQSPLTLAYPLSPHLYPSTSFPVLPFHSLSFPCTFTSLSYLTSFILYCVSYFHPLHLPLSSLRMSTDISKYIPLILALFCPYLVWSHRIPSLCPKFISVTIPLTPLFVLVSLLQPCTLSIFLDYPLCVLPLSLPSVIPASYFFASTAPLSLPIPRLPLTSLGSHLPWLSLFPNKRIHFSSPIHSSTLLIYSLYPSPINHPITPFQLFLSRYLPSHHLSFHSSLCSSIF